MTEKKNFRFVETDIINGGRDKKYSQGSVNPVIQRASSIVFESLEEKNEAANNKINGQLYYGRRGTLTHFALQDSMTALEKGEGCYLFPCGAAAVTHSIMAFVKSGDNILMTGSAYEPTQAFCNGYLQNIGVSTTYYDPSIGAGITSLLLPETKVVFLESPGSMTMEVQDVPSMVRAVRTYNPEIIIIIDNTWSAGLFLNALSLGVDVSVQAATKYIIGHSDAMLGTAVANKRCWPILREHAHQLGQIIDPETAYLGSRGLRTLHVRLKQHEENGLKIAHWLQSHPAVHKVYHPALPSCPGHEFFNRDFTGSSGLFSFELTRQLSPAELSVFLDNFRLFHMAYSWGGFESLVIAMQPEGINAIRPAGRTEIKGTLVRLHVGLENPADLIEDLHDALARIK